MRALLSLMLLVFLGITPALAQDAGDEPTQAQEEAIAPKNPRRPDPEALFLPLDLPTPTEARLASGAPGPAYWQQQVDYTIRATLDAPNKRLNASMSVSYHNNSPHTLTYIWLQLEQNLFRTDSIGTRTRIEGGVMGRMDEPFDGGFEISNLRASTGESLDLAVYDTLARFDLPRPLKPGQTFAFSLDFAFNMPPYLRRMGAEDVEQGRIFEYAQWFPHVCTYDDVHGWNTLPYMGTGEFYTNYGNYDVKLTVPASHLVAATGVLQNPEDVLTEEQQWRILAASVSDESIFIRSAEQVGDPASRPASSNMLTWHFTAENVRTFAWASSESFIWDACSAEITDVDGSKRRVLCQSLYPKEAEAWLPSARDGGSSQYVKHAIEFYSDWLYPYPYPIMSNINGPEGGMEYPMIVFCGSRRGRGPFGVTDHEVGHTWFPMIVNTDERRHIWMDEGFNTFINGYSERAFREKLARARGEQPADNPRGNARGRRASSRPASQPIATAPDRMEGRNVGALGYGKTGLAMTLLRDEVLGAERFDRAFREYIRRWVFKSPQPADFFRTMEDAAGVDLAWFWRQWFYETGTLDLAIRDVEIDEGVLSFSLWSLGEQVMPTAVEIRFSDGSVERHEVPVEAWHSQNEWEFEIDLGEREVARIAVDPGEALPDADRSDNTWEPAGG